MTNLPEAKLAREASISYATLAMATDYDCWHEGHDDVTVEQVVAVLRANVSLAKRIVATAVPLIAAHDGPAPHHEALQGRAAHPRGRHRSGPSCSPRTADWPRVLLMMLLLALFSCVTAENARKSDARTDLGTAYLKEGNAPGAVEALRQATRLNPQNSTAWERLALAYMASDAYELAEEAFDKAIKLRDIEEPARVVYNYGLLLVKLGRNEEALEQFDLTLSDLTYRTPAKALNSKGFTLYELGRYEKAIETLSDAPGPTRPQAVPSSLSPRARLSGHGPPQEALDDFETVIQTCGDDAMGAYYHAAEALFILGETHPAVRTSGPLFETPSPRPSPSRSVHSPRRSVERERTPARARTRGLVTG